MNYPTLFRDSFRTISKHMRSVCLALLLFPPLLYAQLPEKPQSYLSDTAHVLTAEQAYKLEALLRDFEQQTQYELAVLTVSSLNGYDVQQYALEVSEKWKIGKKQSNNGILVLLAPHERKVNISTGYGVEGILTDAVCNKIIRNIGIPFFKTGNYANGLVQTVNELIHVLTDGNYRQQNYNLAKSTEKTPPLWVLGLIFLGVIVILPLLFSGSKTYSNRSGSSPFFPFIGGGFGGRSDGGSGFGGFGGGSFGGGGSSGSW